MSSYQDILENKDLGIFYDGIQLINPYQSMQLRIVTNLESHIKKSVHNYQAKKSDIQLISRKYYEKHKTEMSLENTTYLKNAFSFIKFKANSPQEIEPILFHYSWQFFVAFFKNTFFKWSSRPQSHGMHTVLADQLTDVKLTLSRKPSGSFQQLIDCLTVLGIPTVWSEWLPVPKERLLMFERNDLSNGLGGNKFSVECLLNFDISKFVREVNQMYGKMGFGAFDDRLLFINEEIVDYVLVFVASNLARYKPALWNRVIRGEDDLSADLHKRIQDAYAHYTLGTRTRLAFQLEREGNFLRSIQKLIELGQNDRWLTDHFIGSFVVS